MCIRDSAHLAYSGGFPIAGLFDQGEVALTALDDARAVVFAILHHAKYVPFAELDAAGGRIVGVLGDKRLIRCV